MSCYIYCAWGCTLVAVGTLGSYLKRHRLSTTFVMAFGGRSLLKRFHSRHLQVRHPGAAPNAVPWSSMEEQLLCAVVHEFGPNFAFAADVLAGCSQLQGIFRRASQCKEKFKQLTVSLTAHSERLVTDRGSVCI